MSAPSATATIEVPATADAVYGWVSDLDTLAGFGEEVHAMRWVTGERAEVGSVFRGSNRHGVRRWSTTCTVTAAEPGRRFGFRVTYLGVPIARWEYAVEPTGDASCRVTESTWDERPRWFRSPARLATGVADRTAANEEHIRATLCRVQEHAHRGGAAGLS